MTNLTIAWILLTLPFVLFAGAILFKISNLEKKDKMEGFIIFVFLLIWWGIYFLIK